MYANKTNDLSPMKYQLPIYVINHIRNENTEIRFSMLKRDNGAVYTYRSYNKEPRDENNRTQQIPSKGRGYGRGHTRCAGGGKEDNEGRNRTVTGG